MQCTVLALRLYFYVVIRPEQSSPGVQFSIEVMGGPDLGEQMTLFYTSRAFAL